MPRATTVGVYDVPVEDAHRYGVLDLDGEGRIVNWEEKLTTQSGRGQHGHLLLHRDTLVEQLQADADDAESNHDFGRNIIPKMFRDARVFGYPYSGYWRDVGTVASYWESNMELVLPNPPCGSIAMSPHSGRPGRQPQRLVAGNRARFGGLAGLPGGWQRDPFNPVAGRHHRGGRRGAGQHHPPWLRYQDRAVVDRSILDKEVVVGRNAVVGEGDESVANFERPDIVNSGISIIGKRVSVPSGLHVGRNVVIGPGVSDELSEIARLESGSSVHPRVMPLHLFV
ncbi:MAG: sugar phosphate nucleotidyltransferase [Dehalococcoidia bacterium]